MRKGTRSLSPGRLLILAGLVAVCRPAAAQTWTPLAHNAPGAVQLMLLLPDGTVMAAANNGTSTIGRGWFRLTPDSHGSYQNGNWTTLASMIDTRLYYSAQVLRDGRVFVAGGEYGTGGARAEVYNPQTNAWTAAPVPTAMLNPSLASPVTGIAQQFYDSNSEILPDGRVIITPVCPRVAGQSLIYDPVTNTWAEGPLLFRGGYQDEASWAKLPDSSIITIDPFGTNSERYYPLTNTWINDSNVPVSLYDPFGHEMGGALLCPDGRAFFLGSTGQTAFYTPSGTSAPGAWAAGPVIPSAQGTPDAPAAMLVTGRILCAVSPVPTSGNHFPAPTRFYEFDPITLTYTSVNAPGNLASDNRPTYTTAMLNLPDGGILYSRFAADVYIYRPAGLPLAAGKPVVTDVHPNGDGSYHVTGTGLNGISEGATYGDDLQMNSNYPLVRLSDGAGNVYYARTYNWSSTGVMTGALTVTTEYRLPATLPSAQYSLSVVANGIASDVFCTTPSLTSPPAPIQYGCTGGAASFTVAATGSSLTYQWQRAGTPLFNGGSVSGADTATLVLTGLTPADSDANYTVVVSNGCGSVASGPASLTVRNGGYANCDNSTTAPILNVADFSCFLQAYAAGDPYANCDGSNVAPILNVADFSCFLTQYAVGCPR